MALTFQQLCKREPRLQEVFDDAKKVKSRPGFCANAVWYARATGFRERLTKLVGWEREGPEDKILKSTDAYDLAYDQIYDALPNCQHAGLC